MKNPHGVEPTRFMKRIESRYAIICNSISGPLFHIDVCIHLGNYLNDSFINNNGTNAYECHPEYKSSLFVNTAGSDKANKFSVLDYEVFGIMKLEDCNNSLKQTQKKTRHKKY